MADTCFPYGKMWLALSPSRVKSGGFCSGHPPADSDGRKYTYNATGRCWHKLAVIVRCTATSLHCALHTSRIHSNFL